MQIAFRRWWRVNEVIKGITPRRLAAARRALQRERDKMPLFAELIAENQPTPEERITKTDLRLVRIHQKDRERRASLWQEARSRLRSLSKEDRDGILDYWNSSHLPKDPSYLSDLIRSWTIKGWRPAFYGEDYQKQWAEGRKRVAQLLARWRREGRIKSAPGQLREEQCVHA